MITSLGVCTIFQGTGAADLKVVPTLTADDIAAASVSGGPADGSNALAIAESGSAVDAAYRQFVNGMGADVQSANRQAQIQQQITQQVDTARAAASGVNIDEEMTNMMSSQHAYQAAARFLTTVDELLDTLIHSTGLVGR